MALVAGALQLGEVISWQALAGAAAVLAGTAATRQVTDPVRACIQANPVARPAA